MPNLNLWPILETLTIRTKTGKMIKLDRNAPLAWAQRELVAEIEWQYNHGLPVRIIVLKGRQLGCSTVTEAILFIWCFLHKGTAAMVLADDKSNSEYLFGMTKRYWEMGLFHGMFPTNYDRIGYIEWAGVDSNITVETAKKEDVGRSRTIQAVHGSEVARWSEAEGIVGSLFDAMAHEWGTIMVLESTAKGVGDYFHEEWVKATDPDPDKSMFTPMFFPWFEHDEYEIPGHHLTYSDLDDDERDLLAAYPKLNLAKLAWRRRKISGYVNPQTFCEEFPMCPEEAFLSTGSNLFNLTALATCYEPDIPYEQGFLYNDNGILTFCEDPSGHTWVWQRPDPRKQRRYVVAVDTTQTVEGDPACIQVMDRANMEQVAVWHGQSDPHTIGEIALALAIWYGPETILNTEIQGGGRVVLKVWRDHNNGNGWPHIWMDRRPDRPKLMMQALGWNQTYETKTQMIGTMQGVIARRQVKIHHRATNYELQRYVTNEDGTFGPSRRSGHDDCVISLGIAIMTVVTESRNLDYAAYAAPGPAHIPGKAPPRFASQAMPKINRSVADRMGWDDPADYGDPDALIGILETY